ncbi:MAG: hypothetical protein QOJ76_142 [Acidobacteriota bacterium]|nr:hypothetical protein [Acidobacteriota bacterium]
MRNLGIGILVGAVALTGLLLLVWVFGLVFGVGGGLIHLLLVLAILVAPVGIAAGVVLIVIGSRQSPRR